MTLADGNLYAVLSLSYGVRHVDGYLCGERLLADVVLGLGIVCCYGAYGLGGFSVDFYRKVEQFAAPGRTAAIAAHAAAHIVAALVEIVVITLERVFR